LAAVWQEILALLGRHGITNYSIYLKEPENLLFGYWQYRGTDYAAPPSSRTGEPSVAATAKHAGRRRRLSVSGVRASVV
jgi:hypothetical protein